MRYVLAAVLICAIGAPAAFAASKGGSGSRSVAKASSAQAAKKKAPRAQKGGGDGGIHPLVGSGEY